MADSKETNEQDTYKSTGIEFDCDGKCMSNAEYLYEHFKRKGLIEKLRKKKEKAETEKL